MRVRGSDSIVRERRDRRWSEIWWNTGVPLAGSLLRRSLLHIRQLQQLQNEMSRAVQS